jgi:hypothetical protein
MLSKNWKLMALVAIISLLVAPGLVLAGSAGSGPDEALTPTGTWTQIDAGEQHWYAFEYRGHHKYTDADDEQEDDVAMWVGSQVEVSMDVEPDLRAGFKIVTPEQVTVWAAGQELENCGCGTENESVPAELFWSGNFSQPGTYYVVVEHTGPGTEPAFYTLQIQGQDVSLPEHGPAEAVVETPAEVEPAEPLSQAGSGPEDALAPSDEWVLLPVGETYWFAFQYQGHHRYWGEDDEEVLSAWVGSELKILLDVEPDGGATFSVWTPEQVRRWGLGEDVDPVGRGTENENEPGDLFWSGSFAEPGRYYVVVEHQGTAPSSFQLSISGEVVSP